VATSQAGRSGHMAHRAQPRVSPRAGFQERIRAAFSEKKVPESRTCQPIPPVFTPSFIVEWQNRLIL